MDNDVFENEKLFDVQNEYGPLGEVIYFRLLCLINKNGYYYQFKNLDTLAAMLIRSIGNRWARDKKTVKEVILCLAKNNLFSEELMQRNVITSRGVQERYLLAVERRQSKIVEYNLLEKNDFEEGLLNAPKIPVSVAETQINVTETPINVNNNATKESKVKKSKVKESKGRENGRAVSEPPALRTYGEFQHIRLTGDEYNNLVEKYGRSNIEKYIKKMDVYLEESGRTYKNCYLALQKWLDSDNVRKELSDGFDADKYESLVNQF